MSDERIVYRGFGFGELLLAALTGAAAGAAFVYFNAPASGSENRKRLTGLANTARSTAEHVPEALEKAMDAAQRAFVDTLEHAAEQAARKRA